MRFRRFLSVLFCVVIISAMSLPVYAAESVESEVKEMTWGDAVVKYAFKPLYDVVTGVVVGAAEAIDTMTDETRENFQANVIDNLEFWKDIVDALTYDDYVATLPDGISVSNTGVTAFGTGYTYTTDSTYEELGDLLWQKFDIYTAAANAELGQFLPITANRQGQLVGLKKHTNTNTGLDALQFYSVTEQTNYLSPYSLGTIPFQNFVSFDSFYMETTCSFTITGYSSTHDTSPYFVYLNYSDAYAAYEQLDLTSGYIHYLLPETYIEPLLQVNSVSYYQPIKFYNLGRLSIADAKIEVVTATALIEYKNYGATSSYYTVFPLVPNKVLLDIAAYPTTTRNGSLMQTINNYNGDYSYTDNSTAVNYYIGVPNDDGTVDELYSMNFYDEETLVFTEPTSGYQILSTGWTYDYPTRTYDIAVASGTTTTDMGVDVTRITASYGDEAVTMTAYLADGTEYLTEEFSYVAVSQSESALCSHSYTYETISEPTCITPGERKYTCSICGNEYAEDVAALGHDWVLSEETDTEQTYECSVCGMQYTSTDGTSPPTDYDDGTGGSGSGSSDDESIWDKLGRLIGTLLDGIVDLFDAVLGKLLDSLINLADTISTKCTQIVDRLLTMLDDIPRLFGAFPDFLGAVFPFIPEDIMLIIEFGIAAAVFVGVLLLILKR